MKDTDSLVRYQLNNLSLALVLYVILSSFVISYLYESLARANETIDRVVNVQYKIVKYLDSENK